MHKAVSERKERRQRSQPHLLVEPNNAFSRPGNEVLAGGPLAPSSLFLLYQESIHGIAYESSRTKIQKIIEKNTFSKTFLLKGISFWKPMKLDQEIKENYWLPCCPSLDLFNVSRQKRYSYALNQMKLVSPAFSSVCGHS